MDISKALCIVDAHTAGEPLRLIVAGVPLVKGSTMAEKQQYFVDHFDRYRKGILYEPRGHNDMFGALLLPPSHPEADLGVLFMNRVEMENMCGHGAIAVATIAVELGYVKVSEPLTVVKLDTPAGLVRADVSVAGGKAKDVTLRCVPSFLLERDLTANVPEFGELTIDVGYGGNFFALVDAAQIGEEISTANYDKLIRIGLAAKDVVNGHFPPAHPLYSHIRGAIGTILYDAAERPGADMLDMIVVGEGSVDRSPCGTGVACLMAVMHAKGRWAIEREVVVQSFIGTKFAGKLLGETLEGGLPAIDSQIKGSAWITGMSQLFFDDEDPVEYGFSVK